MLGWGAGEDEQAECPDVSVRLITAPGAGTFVPGECQPTTPHGAPVAAGDIVGLLIRLGGTDAVRTPFTGRLRGLLALPGERVRNHQPLAWLTIDDDEDDRQETAQSVRSTD